ncbi:MAG: threonine--tRNA ligase [Candidatus Aenigmatarchaeota archaeon]|nr:MAG: threonine--tRNA ligase [Candidatus Aenigmarchaeota archaeon]
MKLLLLHADYIEWEPKKKAVSVAEETEKKPKKVEEALVVLTAVEQEDEKNPKAADEAVKEIESVFQEVKAKNIVLYPYAHLSSELAKPSEGLKIIKKMEAELKEKGFSVFRSPFGWYKAFTLKVKGHPLSELSKKISFDKKAIKIGKEEIPEALKKEETLKSEWFILEPSGKFNKIEIKNGEIAGFDFKKHPKLEKFARYEMAKSRKVVKEPPHIKLMRKLELVDYEPGSDPGNLKYYPKGRLIKSLIEEWVTQKTIEYGAMEVETPVMYDIEHPALKKYLHRFPARQYNIKTPNKNVFLRFSACFGQFLMANNINISYRNLPLRIYELTRYSFRVEQRGELAGLRRLRAFTMPDCHALVKDMEQAKQEMIKRFELAKTIMDGLELHIKDDFEFAIRVVKDVLEENKDFVINLVKKWGKPALLEVWDKKFFYFVLKHEWNFVDALDKAATLTTDQIDVENAERYGIMYMDKDNKKKYPLILHLSPSGAVERVIYALLEKAYMELEKKKNPVFPLWLCPVQVRLCPVSDEYLEYAQETADKIANENIRIDLDDRIESVGKKIRDAETEWIPYIVVVGEKEKETKKLAVRKRETGKVENMSLESLIKEIKTKTEGFPFKPLPLPRELSKRPVFVG